MAGTKHNNFMYMAAGPVDWPGQYNMLVDQLERGRTLLLTAGEPLVKGNPFYIKPSDGKAYKSNSSTAMMGLWADSGTPAGSSGFGQVDGIMTIGVWNVGLVYTDANGALTQIAGGKYVGFAISSTEILIRSQW